MWWSLCGPASLRLGRLKVDPVSNAPYGGAGYPSVVTEKQNVHSSPVSDTSPYPLSQSHSNGLLAFLSVYLPNPYFTLPQGNIPRTLALLFLPLSDAPLKHQSPKASPRSSTGQSRRSAVQPTFTPYISGILNLPSHTFSI